MQLDDLSPDELGQLIEVFSAIRDAASILSEIDPDGERVRVRLCPGRGVEIHSAWAMPQIWEDVSTDRGTDFELVERDADPRAVPAETVTVFTRQRAPCADTTAAAPAPQSGPGPSTKAAAVEDAPKSGGVVSGPLTGADRAAIAAGLKAGDDVATIARHLRRRIQTVALYVNRLQAKRGHFSQSPPWSEEELGTALRMLRDGAPATAIAAELGRPMPGTEKKCCELRKQLAGMAENEIPAGPRAAPVQEPAEPAEQGGQGPDSAGVTPVPETAPAAPVNGQRASPAPAVSPAVDAGAAGPVLSSAEREIRRALEGVPARRGFDRELDLEVVEGFARGMKTELLALDLDVDGAQLVARMRELTACIRDDRGHITIEGQARLLTVLRQMVREARAA